MSKEMLPLPCLFEIKGGKGIQSCIFLTHGGAVEPLTQFKEEKNNKAAACFVGLNSQPSTFGATNVAQSFRGSARLSFQTHMLKLRLVINNGS